MPYTIEYRKEIDCIFATFEGAVTMSVVREYIAELLPLLEQTGCRRLLSDSRNADIQLSSRDIMQFPKLAAESPLTENLKRAALARAGTSGYELYETLSKLQRQRLKIFTDRDEALAWLLAEGGPDETRIDPP